MKIHYFGYFLRSDFSPSPPIHILNKKPQSNFNLLLALKQSSKSLFLCPWILQPCSILITNNISVLCISIKGNYLKRQSKIWCCILFFIVLFIILFTLCVTVNHPNRKILCLILLILWIASFTYHSQLFYCIDVKSEDFVHLGAVLHSMSSCSHCIFKYRVERSNPVNFKN